MFKIAKTHLFENYQIADDMLAGREYFFDHFTAPDAHFFWCFRRGTLFDIDMSQFRNCTAHFERMKTRPSVQKLLAFESSGRSLRASIPGGYNNPNSRNSRRMSSGIKAAPGAALARSRGASLSSR